MLCAGDTKVSGVSPDQRAPRGPGHWGSSVSRLWNSGGILSPPRPLTSPPCPPTGSIWAPPLPSFPHRPRGSELPEARVSMVAQLSSLAGVLLVRHGPGCRVGARRTEPQWAPSSSSSWLVKRLSGRPRESPALAGGASGVDRLLRTMVMAAPLPILCWRTRSLETGPACPACPCRCSPSLAGPPGAGFSGAEPPGRLPDLPRRPGQEQEVAPASDEAGSPAHRHLLKCSSPSSAPRPVRSLFREVLHLERRIKETDVGEAPGGGNPVFPQVWPGSACGV